MDQKELMAALTAAAETPVSHADLSASTQRIKVDMDSRIITGYTEFGVIKDHLAENIIFEVKRYKGDTDLAEKHCAIHWENGKNGGVVPVTEIDLSEDGHILMRWELSDEFTQYAGSIAYALHFFSILDGGFTYHAATNAAVGTLGTTLNASAHSKNKITPSEIEVYIAKMNELSASMDAQVVLAQEAAAKAESIAEQLAEKTGQIDLNTQKNAQHDSEIAALTQSKSDAITVEKSGTSIVATDSSDKGFEQFRTYGGSKQEKTSGKQLFDKNNENMISNTYINMSGNTIGIPKETNNYSVVLEIEPNTNYTINVSNNNRLRAVALKEKIDETISNSISPISAIVKDGKNSLTLTTGNEDNYLYVNLTDDANMFLVCIDSLMVNKGTTFLPWEPYTGGIPSPNPEYPQPIVSAGQKLVDGVVTDVGIGKKLTGKNLLQNTAVSKTVNGVTFTVNNDKSITINGTNDNTNVSDLYIYGSSADNGNYLSIPKGCVASFEGIQNTSVELICREKETVTYNLEQLTNLLAERDCQFYGIFLRVKDGVSANTTICPMIRYADIEDDTYEPYTEQTLTLNHVLRGIPVTDASLANYTDENGKMWCADYVDAERKVWVQCDNGFIVDGINENNIYSTSDGIKWWCSVSVRDSALYHKSFSAHTNVMCDKFTIVHTQREDDEATGTCMSAYGHADYLEFRFRFLQSDYPTKEDVINAVKGTIVYYPLATPIETPLTDEEIIAYKALHSNKPTTIITNNAGCMMEVAYVADPKNHIEQNYVPVSKYTALEERVSALEQLHV